MKKLLVLLSLFTLLLSVNASTITRVPKDARHQFGTVNVLQNNYAPGQPFIIFLHGQGECGDGSYTSLGLIQNWGGVQYLYQAADLIGFNVIAVQTASRYQYGEIQYVIKYAIDSLKADPTRIYGVFNSLGGYGFAQQSGLDTTLPGKFAAVTQVVMGPGEGTNTASNIAKAKLPIWFFSSADDLTSGTTVYKTDTLYNRIVRLGGNAWYTRWVKGGHGVISRVVGSYYQMPNNWKLAVCSAGSNITATNLCAPPSSIYSWFLSNRKGSPVVPPTAPTPIYAPLPVTPADLPKLKTTIKIYSNDSISVERN